MGFLILIFIAYVAIGALFSLYWVRDSIKKYAENDEQWDALAYIFRCCFKWPAMISDKDLR